MRALAICFALLLATSYAVGVHRSLTNAQIRKIENLKNGNSWGSLLVNLAEMHILAKGPLDELISAINEVVADNERKTDQTHTDFDKRTNEHNSETRRLSDLITEANRNIADSHELIDNLLVPQRGQLQTEIANLERQIVDTKAYIVTATAEREQAHNDYLIRVDEHNAGVEAVNEALGILGQLTGETSLAQVKKIHKSVEKVTKKIQGMKTIESTFVKALLALTNSGFANSEAIQKVTNLLLQVKGNLEQSLIDEGNDENSAEESFVADIKHQNQNINDFTASLGEKQVELARTEEQIASSNQFIEQREADRAGFNTDLNNENAAYDDATKNYNDLVAQLQNEHAACVEALSVVENATIDDYIGGRMSQTSEHVIDTNHGSGVSTGAGNVNFQ